MMWEYHVASRYVLQGDIMDVKNWLNSLGELGWELVCTTPTPVLEFHTTYYFKKYKRDPNADLSLLLAPPQRTQDD